METSPKMTVASPSGGTGSRLPSAVVIVAGVASLIASLLSLVSIWLQTKNYRKPLLQRYVVRILLMVPIYSAASWTSIISTQASLWLSPIRDIYEAFTIYTFFQLLINFLGGERALIVMTHGRPPVEHAWPLNHVLPKVDISDPHTFLTMKRGILQYAWLKPILAAITIIMRATDAYQEGYIGLTSGYLWIGIVYNISVTLCLYSLAMFWVCMHNDLKPFRPVPKFLSVKLIIFASYWQGFFLSILQWLGAIPNGVGGYSADNLAAAIQDSLICFEMPIFAVTHWYAFSWHDYADSSISAARMPVKYAVRDSFGIRDLIEDTKETFAGKNYGYRSFDSGDNVMAHEESHSRVARVMDGMRYERGGKAKYWIPKPGEVNSRTPLLTGQESGQPQPSTRSKRGSRPSEYRSNSDVQEAFIDEEDEQWFVRAREIEYGDWNYPVITANEVSRDQRLSANRRGTETPVVGGSSVVSHYVKKSTKHKRRLADECKGKQRSGASGTNSKARERKESVGDRGHRESASSSSRSSQREIVDHAVQGDHDNRKGSGSTRVQDQDYLPGVGLREPLDRNEQHSARHDSGPEDSGGRRGPEFTIGEDEETEESETSPHRDMRYDGAFDEERNIWDS